MIGLFLTIFRNSLPKKFLQINNSTENLCSILASNFNKSWSIRNVSWMKKINGTANQKLDKVVEEPTSKIEVSSKSIEIAVDPFVPLKTAYRYFYTEPEKIYNFQKCVQSIRNFHDSSTEPQILTVPEFPDGSAKGDLKIQKKENDKVNAHEVLFKIETERSYVYVTAPTDGVLIQNLLPDGAKVIPGQELAKFGQNTPIATEQKKIISSLKPLNLTNQKNVFEKGPSNLKQDSPMELLESSPKSTWGTSTSHTDKIMKDKTSTSSTQIASTKSNSGTEEIREHKIFLPKNFNALKGAEEQIMKVPKYPDGSTTGKIKWFKRKYGQVDENELLFKIETNKTFIYIAAPNMGTVTEVFVKDGQNVETGQKLFKIKNKPTKGNLRTLPYYTTSKFKDLPAPAKSPKQIKEPLIKQKGIPFQFRIAPMTIIPPKARPRPKKATVTETRKEYRVKMSNTRQQIANRLKKTQNTKAMLTTFNEIDMSDIIKYRNNNLEKFKQIYGFNFSYISVFCKSVANAIRDQPIINAVIDSNDIVYRDFVDISIAIATKIELLEPIIKNVDKMNFMDIEKTIQEMVYKARTGILAIKDEEGGTFTISNGGVFGSLLGTPIINPSQSSILGMHSIINRPIAFDGEIKIRPMMYVALTYDNRLINGQEAVNFLKKIKNYVEEPSIILKDVKLSQ